MLSELKQYLLRVKSQSKLDPKAENEVVRELQTHFEDEIGELCEEGLSTTEAADIAAERFGRAEALGRAIYEVYNRGTWKQALFAATPHILIALTFALHLWSDSFWLIAVSLGIVSVTIYIWWHGRPSWCYSWLGYFLICLFAISFLVVYAVGRFLSQFLLEGTFQWVLIVAYVPVALWLIGYILIQVVRRDWLFASFMLLPFPVIVAWLIAVEQDIGVVQYIRDYSQSSDQGIAWTFIALGGAAGAFIRFRQRLLKIGVLAVATVLILAMVWRFTESGLNPVLALFVSFSLVSFLLSPVILQGRVTHRCNEIESWDEAWLKQAAKRT